MECSFCGSQDTTFKTGISKSGKNAGKPWKAYDCNEPQCKNEKGYPNRTWAPNGGAAVTQKPRQAPVMQPLNIGKSDKKLDTILLALKRLCAASQIPWADIENGLDEEAPF